MTKDVAYEVESAHWESDSYWEAIVAIQNHSPIRRALAWVYNTLPGWAAKYVEEWAFYNLTHPAEIIIAKIIHDAVGAYMEQIEGGDNDVPG